MSDDRESAHAYIIAIVGTVDPEEYAERRLRKTRFGYAAAADGDDSVPASVRFHRSQIASGTGMPSLVW